MTLRILINERERISDTKVVTCCKLCSSSVLEKSELLFALSQNLVAESFRSLLREHYQANDDELSPSFEVSNLDDNTTTILRLTSETSGGLKIIEKTRNKLRSDGVNAIMQITGIVDIKETMNICLRLHDFMYRLRAFSEIGNLKFSASVSGMSYATDFFPRPRTHGASGEILTGTSHYYKSPQHDELDFTFSAPTSILFPESLGLHDKAISFELMTACSDRPGTNDQTLISLYFAELHGLCEPHDKISSSTIGSIFPFVRLGITVNDIDFHPDSDGVLTPDIVLLGSKSSNLPNLCTVVLRLSWDKSMETKNTIQMISTITNNFESILSYNASVIQATFLHNMERSLNQHFQVKTQQKLSSDLETGISLTVSSIRDIVSMSQNVAFRETCFSMFNVDNEHSLGVAIVDKLMTIVDVREEGTSRKRRYNADEDEV